MANKRLIVCVQFPFTNRDYVRFGLQTILQKGFVVEVWDCTPLIYPDLGSHFTPPDPFVGNLVRVFDTDHDLAVEVKTLSSSDVVWVEMGYRIRIWGFLRALSRTSAKWGMVHLGAVPAPVSQKVVTSRLRRLLRHPKNLKEHFFFRAPLSMLGIRPMDFILVGGTAARPSMGAFGPRTRWIGAHCFDFDQYLEVLPRPISRTDRYAVYHDEYTPYHPEFALEKININITPERFYSQLGRFFDDVERATDVRIVVAAHPRSDYSRTPNPFGGREIVRGQTAELVRDARFSIAHISTSQNFAFLFRKPIVHLMFREFVGGYYEDNILPYRQYTGKDPIFVDSADAVDWTSQLVVDSRGYQAFVDRFIESPDAEEIPLADIVIKNVLMA